MVFNHISVEYLYYSCPHLFFFTAIIKNEIVVLILLDIGQTNNKSFFYFSKNRMGRKTIKKRTYIFCPNHVSTLDVPFILAVLPIPLQYIGKAEIAKIPLFGYFYKENSVIVDRANRKDAYSAFLKAGEKLKTGINMCIFPEGGIPKEDVFLKKFKNGSFRLAIEQNIKIVPITLADNKKYVS